MSSDARQTAVLPGLRCLDHTIRQESKVGSVGAPLRGITLFPPQTGGLAAATLSSPSVYRGGIYTPAAPPGVATCTAGEAAFAPPGSREARRGSSRGIAKANRLWEKSVRADKGRLNRDHAA